MRFLPILSKLFVMVLGFHVQAQIELPAEKILASFGENCSTNGKLAASTSEQAKVLINLLTEIKDNPGCSTLPYAMANAQLLASNANKYDNLAVTQTESEYLMAMREERILLTALAAAKTDPNASKNLIETIESQLQFIQKSLLRASQNLTSSRKSEIFLGRNRTYNSLVQTSQSLFSAGIMGDGCWSSQKPWIEGVTLAATSMLASTLSSTYSLPISAAAELLGQIMEVIRVAKINSSISRVSDSIAQKAYQCGIERMAENWCQARDQKLALTALAQDLVTPKEQTPALTGLHILDEDLPIVLKWLEKISIGFRPTNVDVAERQSRYLNRRTLVDRALIEGWGIIQERRAIFEKAPSAEHRWFEVKRAITDLRSNLQNLSVPLRHPVFEQVSEKHFPYFLMGLEESTYPRDGSGNTQDWESYLGSPNYVSNIEVVKTQFEKILASAGEAIRRERTDILNSDAVLLLSDALELDVKDRSPYESLKIILDYLTTNAPTTFVGPVEEKLYRDLYDKFAKILSRISGAGSTIGPQTALQEIYEIAKLDFGSVLFEVEARKSIRLALNSIPFRHDISIQEASILANEDFIQTFELLKEGGGLDDARDDANSAQTSTFTNLDEFGKIFEDGIKKVLENYAKKESIEGGNGPSRELRALLCYKLYSLPTWPKGIKTELCEGTSIQSSIPDGPSTKSWSKRILEKKLEERICLYYDYKRQRKIYQDTCQRRGEKCRTGEDG